MKKFVLTFVVAVALVGGTLYTVANVLNTESIVAAGDVIAWGPSKINTNK